MGEDAATNLISNFVFYISIGINVYIIYYLLPTLEFQPLFTIFTQARDKAKCSLDLFSHPLYFLFKKKILLFIINPFYN